MKAIIIYGAISGIIRRVIMPSFPGEPIDQGNLIAGEAATTVSYDPAVGLSPAAINAAVSAATAIAVIPSGRCVVVTPLRVAQAVIMADPLIDDPTLGGLHPGAILALSDTSVIGDKVTTPASPLAPVTTTIPVVPQHAPTSSPPHTTIQPVI
jgi:hypothetical protein